jgi:hypothetical protein
MHGRKLLFLASLALVVGCKSPPRYAIAQTAAEFEETNAYRSSSKAPGAVYYYGDHGGCHYFKRVSPLYGTIWEKVKRDGFDMRGVAEFPYGSQKPVAHPFGLMCPLRRLPTGNSSEKGNRK